MSCYLEVDPALLRDTGLRLRDAIGVARQVGEFRGTLTALAGDSGHAGLTEAVCTFLDTWSHGLGCLVEDAETLATMLADAGTVYAEVEATIAGACG